MGTDIVSFEANAPDPFHVNLAVGHKLKILREAFGLSQRELAKKAGVTNSNISMIEQGQVSPSIQSLSKILDGFPISLSEFFSSNLLINQSPLLSSKTIRTHTDPQGIITHHLHTDSQHLPELIRKIFPPGATTSLQTAGSDFIGWVLSGELQMQVTALYFELKPLNAFHIRQGQIFCFANHDLKETEILIANTVENR